ncbi:hypothetical protein FHS96_000359 [Sphingomonas zeicaulis]|uniref:STM4015 family protein n=1 Tax=Sphingomonas zeicaulis TaxID=1632740 RepID=UPI003D207582
MTVHSNLTQFAGKPVADFNEPGDIKDFAATAPRLRCVYDGEHSLTDLLELLIKEPGVEATQALIFGLWAENGETYEVNPARTIETLIANRDKLPNLSALFFGDIISEENEISWIEQASYAGIWAAFPHLTEFRVRGGNKLSLGKIVHPTLEILGIETGGLPATVVREALAAEAPIRHFELWLGSDDYGADTSVADFADLLEGKLFPQLETLGLRNSEYSDALAEALATAPILDRINTLDLSMGTLSDDGARALIGSGKLGRLEKLDISFHYVSEPVLAELRAATPNLVADEPQKPDDWDGKPHFYIAVSE